MDSYLSHTQYPGPVTESCLFCLLNNGNSLLKYPLYSHYLLFINSCLYNCTILHSFLSILLDNKCNLIHTCPSRKNHFPKTHKIKSLPCFKSSSDSVVEVHQRGAQYLYLSYVHPSNYIPHHYLQPLLSTLSRHKHSTILQKS